MSELDRIRFELSPPDEAATATQAVEVIRAWVLDGKLSSCLNPGVLKGPDVWGCLFADLAGSLAEALEEVDGTKRTDSIQSIIKTFTEQIALIQQHWEKEQS